MKSSPSTRGVAILLMVAYTLYGLFSLGLSTLLMSMAAALIFYGIYENLELAAGVMIVVGVVMSRIMRRFGSEGFEDASGVALKEEEEKKEPAVAEPAAKAAAPAAEDIAKKQKDSFVDINPAPVDSKGGFFIDQGTTLMNALNGLKPDQITSMTNDTKQLIETQKSLMGMLNNLAPMMKEGSNMLTMFNGMFGAPKTAA